jgi:tRNA modification GTPase
MLGKLTGWDDTIVALATPPGIGAIGVIRLSGNKSLELANRMFPSKDLLLEPSHTLHIGFLREGDDILDEVVISIFKGPRSYTGEDVVEISSHGSPYVQKRIMDAILRNGARLAKPGEFTQRAFLNGKLDLTQAEAVADLIASHSEASRKSALHNIRGGFSHDLKKLRVRLLSFSALIELELDFSQEDVAFADRRQLYELVSDAEKMTRELLASFRLGNVIKQGVQVAIVGKPNAGKSTLLNSLLNEDRAIVSEIAGTTRDTIEETIHIDGILFRLIDTAGIRRHTRDLIERMGVGRSLEKIDQADVVLYVFDVNDGMEKGGEDEWPIPSTDKKFLMVGNKVDTIGEGAAIEKFSHFPDAVFISARERKKIDELKKKLVSRVLEGTIQIEGTILTHARHYRALEQVSVSLWDIRKGLDQKLPGDLLTPDIRRCLHFLGEITGEITTEDQLDYIFSKFCIGK